MTLSDILQKQEAARSAILARVSEALRQPAPLPHIKAAAGTDDHGAEPKRSSLPILPSDAARPWLPDGGATREESLRIFIENSDKLRTVVHRVDDMKRAGSLLRSLITERGWKRVACHLGSMEGELAQAIPCERYCVDSVQDSDKAFDKRVLEQCDAGITLCEALVAQTGSVVVSSVTCGGRALSILPHVHIVVAMAEQLTATLSDAIAQVRNGHSGRLPSMLSFITGPSRTGDIERILVLGAHGPKELIVVLVAA